MEALPNRPEHVESKRHLAQNLRIADSTDHRTVKTHKGMLWYSLLTMPRSVLRGEPATSALRLRVLPCSQPAIPPGSSHNPVIRPHLTMVDTAQEHHAMSIALCHVMLLTNTIHRCVSPTSLTTAA